MRILITNDDGIYAPGMRPLARWAKKYGEVTVVAPKVEQSGKSHGIDIIHPFEVKKIDLEPGVNAYAVDSTPADCVRFALTGLRLEVDLIISGINRGFNLGRDIMYSGTAGAVFEAASVGKKAIAISTSPAYYPQAVEQLDEVFAYVKEHDLLSYNPIWNINLVPEKKGIRITRQGGLYFSDDFVPQGDDMYIAVGKCVFQDTNNLELDTDAVTHGYTSVMPLAMERVNRAVYEQLKGLNE
ncbi:MAG: 5'/3'-nucleotidase SurE [Lachnospiraceae bacterium]|nr:5'/3'-nucleotidase SurE [Lachnospiraceae bacterium]